MESSSKPRAMDDPGGSVNGIGGSLTPWHLVLQSYTPYPTSYLDNTYTTEYSMLRDKKQPWTRERKGREPRNRANRKIYPLYSVLPTPYLRVDPDGRRPGHIRKSTLSLWVSRHLPHLVTTLEPNWAYVLCNTADPPAWTHSLIGYLPHRR